MHTTHFWHKFCLCRPKTGLATLICLGFFSLAYGQQNSKGKYTNLPDYDNKKLHYGFQIGLFTTAFNLNHSNDFALQDGDSLVSVDALINPGFSLGFIVNFSLKDELWDFRLLPNVSLYERSVRYGFADGTEEIETVQGPYIELPLMFKYKSVRRRNHRMYLTAGMTGGIRVGGKKNEDDRSSIIIKDHNYEISYGLGFHFYMQMFNFAPELRFSHGLPNILNPNVRNPLTNQIGRLTTHKVTLYINFEG